MSAERSEGFPLTGSLHVPDRAQDQYFGRCETAHLRACSMRPYGDSAARKRRTVGNAFSAHAKAEKTGGRGYIAFPSSYDVHEAAGRSMCV
jgi:hypothetical protein